MENVINVLFNYRLGDMHFDFDTVICSKDISSLQSLTAVFTLLRVIYFN